MNNIFEKNSYSREIMTSIFVIVFVSMFVLANIFVGFSMPMYLAAMIPAIMLSFKFPRSGFFAIVFLTFIFERFFTLVPIVLGKSEYKLYPLDIMMLAIGVGILLALAKKEIKINFEKIDFVVAGLALIAMIYGILSIFFFGGESSLAFSSAKNYAFYAILYFMAFFLIQTKEDFKNLAGFAIAGGIGIIGFIIYGVISGEGLWSQYTPLSTGGVRILAFTHGFYLCMLFVFASSYVLLKKGDNFLLKTFAILLPIWTIGIIGSMMRHLWVSLAISSIFVLLMSASKMTESALKLVVRYILFGILISILFAYVLSLIPNSKLSEGVSNVTNSVGKRVTSISNSSDESIFWRSVAWREAFKEYAESPISGAGFGKKISVEIGSYREFVEIRNIHNSFLVLLVQMGTIGALVFAWVIISLAKRLWRRISQEGVSIERIAVLGIFILHLSAFIFQPYLETNLLGIFFWINLGLMRNLGQENIKTLKH